MDHALERRSQLPDAGGKRQPKWPLRLALSLLLVIEVFFVVRFSAEGVTEHILTIVNSIGIIVFCMLTWREIRWSRWPLIVLLVWRLANIGVHTISHMAPGDHRIVGSLILVAIYVAVGSLIASPLGRSSMRATT